MNVIYLIINSFFYKPETEFCQRVEKILDFFFFYKRYEKTNDNLGRRWFETLPWLTVAFFQPDEDVGSMAYLTSFRCHSITIIVSEY